MKTQIRKPVAAPSVKLMIVRSGVRAGARAGNAR